MKDHTGKVIGTQRSHFEMGIPKGNPRSIAALQGGPEMPEALRYLYDWARDLHGRSGIGPHGLNPLTYTTIADWSRLTGTTVYPHEVQALLALDAVMLHPPKPKDERGN